MGRKKGTISQEQLEKMKEGRARARKHSDEEENDERSVTGSKLVAGYIPGEKGRATPIFMAERDMYRGVIYPTIDQAIEAGKEEGQR